MTDGFSASPAAAATWRPAGSLPVMVTAAIAVVEDELAHPPSRR